MTRSTTDAAIFLLSERSQEHHNKAGRLQIAAVYVSASTPPETAGKAVSLTERTYLESTVAEALFHRREAERFDAAIEELQALASAEQDQTK
jgi:DNA-binding SARP family transcriptional activator